jgi:hypothetical protein
MDLRHLRGFVRIVDACGFWPRPSPYAPPACGFKLANEGHDTRAIQQNFYAASLSASVYQHQPQFDAFRTAHQLPFKPYTSFGKQEQMERRDLVRDLVNLIWSPDRLKEFVG